MSRNFATEISILDSPSSLLSWLLEADQAFVALADDDDYGFSELLHCLASRIAPVDACYLCFYRQSDDTLFFPYNFDEGIYDEPLTFARKNGPASWVVSHARPFVLSSATRAIQDANINFGDQEKISQSAIHLPLLARESGEGEVIGVFSIQSYQPNVYEETTVAALQLLCNRAADHLHQRRQHRIHQDELNTLHQKSSHHVAHKIRMANRFVEMSNPVTREAQKLSRLIQTTQISGAQLSEHIESLCRLCFRLQTDISLLPVDGEYASPSSEPTKTEDTRSYTPKSLSAMEQRVVRLLIMGLSNKEIAHSLDRTEHTVKQHCKNIFKKLGAKSRSEAAYKYGIVSNDADARQQQPTRKSKSSSS